MHDLVAGSVASHALPVPHDRDLFRAKLAGIVGEDENARFLWDRLQSRFTAAELDMAPAPAESNDMEDARLVHSTDGDEVTYYATYTAFDGSQVAPHLLQTTDFRTFTVSPLSGLPAGNKGMAMFPRSALDWLRGSPCAAILAEAI